MVLISNPVRAALPIADLDLILSLTINFWTRFRGCNVFITGGTGFIGSWLVQVIQRANDVLGSQINIMLLTRDPEHARKEMPQTYNRSDMHLIAGDICHFAAPFGSFDLCIHAATDVGDSSKSTHPLRVFDSIVTGTRRALDVASASGACRFLLASSGAVYGVQPSNLERVPETYSGAPDSLAPDTAYGNGKRAAEWLAATYAREAGQAGFSVCSARIFALLGPGLPFNGPFAAGNFIRDALQSKAIQLHGDGRPLRSYLYMADLCVWLLHILENGRTGQAYNVGSEEAISVQALAQQVVEVAGTSTPIQVQAPNTTHNVAAPRYVPDTTKARSELGLAQYTSLNAALLKTIEWSRLSVAS